MWEELFRKHSGLTYKKKYICPECEKRAMKIEYDTYSICGECRSTIEDSEKIELIIKNNRKDTYFTEEEYKEKFIPISKEDKEQMIEELISKEKIINSRLSNKQKKLIEECNDKTIVIDDLLDNYCINYWRMKPQEKNNKVLNNEQYILNLLEDAHFFINKVTHDILYYEYSIFRTMEEKKEINSVQSLYYSGRFFVNNAIYHVVDSWERIINILAILYEIEYDSDDSKKNSINRLNAKLNKNTYYNKTKVYKMINEIKGTNEYKIIFTARQENDHGISTHVKLMEEVAKQQDENYLFDKDLKKEYCTPLIKVIKAVLDIIIEVIGIYSEKILVRKEVIHIPAIFKDTYQINYSELEKEALELKPITPEDIKKNYDEILYYINRIEKEAMKFKKPIQRQLFVDIIFRQHEVSRCIVDVLNCSTQKGQETLRSLYPLIIPINRQYFVYSALYRIYSNYDKIGRLISYVFNLEVPEKDFYYEDAVRECIKKKDMLDGRGKELVILMEQIRESREYNHLYYFRNMLTHHMRVGALQGNEGFENCEMFLTYFIEKNSEYINEMLSKLSKYTMSL